MQYTYETIGNSSYLVAVFDQEEQIINYQLQMLTNNEIKNIIKANKRQKNNTIMISYNITSKISLAQLNSRHKMTKLSLIHLIQGALAALEEIEEYQLVSGGMVFEEAYLYVNPSTYEPSFVYLPCTTEDTGMQSLKSLLLSLIMGSRVEMSNDNFVQMLLETLNSAALTAQMLKELCATYQSTSSPEAKIQAEPRKQVYTQAPQPQNVLSQAPQTGAPSTIAQAAPQPHTPPPPLTPPPTPALEQTPKKHSQKKNKAAKKSSPQKGIFIILQLVLIVIIAAIVWSGALRTEQGGIHVQYLFGVLLAAAGIDFVVYRELFCNHKKSAQNTDGASKSPKKNTKKTPMSNQSIPSVPTIKPQPPAQSSAPSVPPAPQPAYTAPQPAPQPPVQASVASVPPAPQPAYTAPQPAMQPEIQVEGFEPDDTVVLDEVHGGAHLEFYENGLVTRIKLDKAVVTVGKLSSQCDFAINSNKISKVHAEFIARGNAYFVKDCNSTNGTYLNGSTERIASNTEYQIFDGNRITLANVELIFRC